MTNGSTHLSTWVTQETKQRFGTLAQSLGLSESALLKRCVDLMLKSTSVTDALSTQVPKAPRDLRLYVRLRADDHALLRERAEGRGMAAATYASMVLRAHLRSVAPLPEREFAELRRSVGALGYIGRNLNQIARVANQSGKLSGPSSADLRALLQALEGLRDHVKALMLANSASWESGHAEAAR
jgi:hypothetical protein